MKPTFRIILFVFVLTTMLLAACGAAATAQAPVAPAAEVAPAATAAPLYNTAEQPSAPAQKDAAQTAGENGPATSNMPGANITVQTGSDALTGAQTGSRMVIKNAEVSLLVEETDNAIDRTLQVLGDTSSYIISSRAWFQAGPDGKNYKYATITIGVPVDQFENVMRRLRGLAMRVLDENASGQDVSDEYVDLQSQLGNLEATRDRIRKFLDSAQSVEESLRVNQELTNIEGEIEKVKGRMNYLANRSAFSTITVTFNPDIPPMPTPTITPTFTPLPTATPQVWNPGKTFGQAKETVVSAYQVIIEMLIWVFIVLVPLLAPPVLVLWGIYKLATRKKNKPASGG
jgi:hypothetical protein